MIRLYKRIIGWLKTIFKGEDMSFEFPELGDEYVAKVENDIGAKKNGKIENISIELIKIYILLKHLMFSRELPVRR